jgi:flavodoxin
MINRSILIGIMTMTMVCTLTGCAAKTNQNEAMPVNTNTAESTAEAAFHQSLIVYFSCTGNTQNIAQMISQYSEGTLYQIIPSQPYTDDDLDYNNSSSRTTIEQNNADIRPEISGSIDQWNQYDVVYIGYPIWWGNEPRILDTFAESYDFSGKTVIPFCTSAESGIGSSGEHLASLSKGSGNWLSGMRFSKDATMQDVTQWINSLEITK